MSDTPTRSPEHRAVMRRLRALNRRHVKATQVLDECEAQRSSLYAEARALVPPITFREIADVFGVTEAAVMQKLKRTQTASTKPKRKPGPE